MDYSGYNCFKVHINDAIVTVTIDHPPINIMDRELLIELDEITRKIETDNSLKVIIFDSANPDFFMAHADLTYLTELSPQAPVTRSLGLFHTIGERLRSMPKVSIAKIEGRARGGGSELSLAADMRFAALEKACFGQPEIGIGLIPGGGGTQRLPRLVGRSRALEIILRGDDVSAELAEQYGYINKALPEEELGTYVDALAERIAKFTTEVIASTKLAINQSEPSLVEGLMTEYFEFQKLIANEASRSLILKSLEMGAQEYDIELDLDKLIRALHSIK